MSRFQNVRVSKYLDLYAVAQGLGDTMSGCQNVLLLKCLGVKMLGVKMSLCLKVMCPNVGESNTVPKHDPHVSQDSALAHTGIVNFTPEYHRK